MTSKVFKENIFLLLIVAVIVVIPLIWITDSEFGGADGEAEGMISEVNPDYEPWASPLMEPPGGETESLLFALQAALGSGAVFFGIGYLKGKSSCKNVSDSTKP